MSNASRHVSVSRAAQTLADGDAQAVRDDRTAIGRGPAAATWPKAFLRIRAPRTAS